MTAQLGIAFGRKVTRSAEEAIDLHRSHRAYLILIGRDHAVRIARQRGTVTSRDVFEALERDGHFEGFAGRMSFLGAIFAGGPFEATGEWRSYSHEARNCHTKSTRVWKLRDKSPTNEHGANT